VLPSLQHFVVSAMEGGCQSFVVACVVVWLRMAQMHDVAEVTDEGGCMLLLNSSDVELKVNVEMILVFKWVE